MDDWKNQLTKTPYLILFIILISVSVGTASALATYTFTGNLIVDGTITADNYFDSDNTQTGINAIAIGGTNNTSTGDYSVIGGGKDNIANDVGSTVSGGIDNQATARYATVSGGIDNQVTDRYSTVGGGINNQVTDKYATIGGGDSNQATKDAATVGGGETNIASGFWSTVPGGLGNVADGDYSFAAGRLAEANHDGTFVWSDSSFSTFESTGADQFLIEADGGVGIGINNPLAQLHVSGGCIGCMKFYQLTQNTTLLVTGTNTYSCNNGDLIMSGGGWVPGTTAWLRESWAIGTDTWKIHFTDASGAGVKPGAFVITCADINPND